MSHTFVVVVVVVDMLFGVCQEDDSKNRTLLLCRLLLDNKQVCDDRAIEVLVVVV